MLNDSRFKVAYITLLLTAIALPGLYLGHLSYAQSTRSFEAKADAELKQTYQLYPPGATLSPARQQEREALKRRVALEERDGRTAVGVMILLREDNAQALDAAQAEIEASNFVLRARIGHVATATVPVDDLPR